MLIYSHDITITNQYAFGDGLHETTRFLLYYLNRYVTGKSYIDAGCGTGILSIFADKCGARSVTAIDFDVNAITCTQNNADINGSAIKIIHSNVEDVELSADIVTANFARHEALVYVQKLKQMVNDGGLLITTWFKELSTDQLNDLKIIDRIEGVEYDALVLFKGDNNASN